jgi:hypothetical protein
VSHFVRELVTSGARERLLTAAAEESPLSSQSGEELTIDEEKELALVGESSSKSVQRHKVPLIQVSNLQPSPQTSLIDPQTKSLFSQTTRLTPPTSADTRSTSSTASSPSPKTNSNDSRFFTPYQGQHLYNGLRPEFDRTAPPFCFVCGARPRDGDLPFSESVERTGFRWSRSSEQRVYVYRPVFMCTVCRSSPYNQDGLTNLVSECLQYYER